MAENDNLGWNLMLRRLPRESKPIEISELLCWLEKATFHPGSDQVAWDVGSNRSFSVKRCYHQIEKTGQRSIRRQTMGLPKKWIWDNQLPARLNLFLWEVDNQAIQTKQKLKIRFSETDATCVLCNLEEESMEHLFFNCQITKQL